MCVCYEFVLPAAMFAFLTELQDLG